MQRLSTMGDFEALRQRLSPTDERELPVLILPAGMCGQASGASDLVRIAKREILENELTDRLRLRITGCIGFCEMEPCVLIRPTGAFYMDVGRAQADELIPG